MNVQTLPSGLQVCFPDREQMRRKGVRRFFRRPMAYAHATPPDIIDFQQGKNGRTVYPMLGNDTKGNCYYVAVLKYVIQWMAQYGMPPNFAVAAVIARYLAISGGDNGLDDDTIFKEFKAGILGPNGPYKMSQDLLVDPNDTEAMDMAMWRFTGILFTFTVYSQMMSHATPGATWNASVCRGSIVGGHAVILSGKTPKKRDLQTWALDPPIDLYPDCVENCDPEAIVCFSSLNYDPVTRLSKAGFTWEQDRQLWISWNGIDPGPQPWPDPTPAPAPNPTPFPEPPNPNPVWGNVLDSGQVVPAQTFNINGQVVTLPAYTLPQRILPVYKQDNP